MKVPDSPGFNIRNILGVKAMDCLHNDTPQFQLSPGSGGLGVIRTRGQEYGFMQ